MKKVYNILLIFSVFILGFESQASNSKFDRALVLEGQNFNTAIHIGIYDGFVENGWNPEVVIGSCGGSIAAALINAIPNSEQRKNYLLSEEFFNTLKSAKYNNPKAFGSIKNMLKKLGGMILRSRAMNKSSDKIPPIFNNYLLEVPNTFDSSFLNQPFQSHGTRAVIVGAKISFSPEDVGKNRNGDKLYREVFFTDEDTATLLNGTLSSVGISFPNSAVFFETEIITDIPLGAATRASISDPYLMNPAIIDDTYYLAGSINLYPLEVAHSLANDVAMVYPGAFSYIEQKALASSFGFNNNARLREVTNMFAHFWVDFSDFTSLGSHHFSAVNLDLKNNKAETNLPDDINSFRHSIQQQWEFGYTRAVEALQQLPNTKNHIRGINKGNSSKEIRNQIQRQRKEKASTFKNYDWPGFPP